jgi:hypothetical protein
MKTPREVLLNRHRAAEPQLDSIREQAVAAMSPKRRSRFAEIAESCREFFRVPRIAWAALAAVWTIIIALNTASSETPAAPMTAAASPPRRSPEMLQALREQKRLFAELVGAAGEKLESEAPRFVPRPRSERSPQTAIT